MPLISNDMIRFSEEDLALFSAASGDRNPLHLSPQYAERTSYGQRVVFGVLGAIACLGRLSSLRELRITSLTADFLRPIFLNLDYRAETTELAGKWIAHLYDGSVLVLSLSVKASAPAIDKGAGSAMSFTPPSFARIDAAPRDEIDITAGLSVSGHYACDSCALTALADGWQVTAAPSVLAVLCFTSYLVGMEVPGRAALFFKLALNFDAPTQGNGTLNYQASVRSRDVRTGQIRTDVAISRGEDKVASGECWAFTRLAPPAEDKEAAAPASDALAGRIALIIGASRGLGAATRLALERHGARVLSISRSAAVGSFELGDAADPDSLQRVRRRILAEHGRLDILVCNASPALLPLRIEPNALPRIQEYISRAVALAAAPLCAFLDLLNDSGGCAVVISSVAAQHPVREWPHYVAAKNAVEALARVAPLQYPRVSSLVVRPEKLLTEMTNTPMGRRGALPPVQIALRIAERLGQPLTPGGSEILY